MIGWTKLVHGVPITVYHVKLASSFAEHITPHWPVAVYGGRQTIWGERVAISQLPMLSK